MKRILNYKTFINESSGTSTLTTEQIDFLNRYVIGKWKLNADGVVDAVGNFGCSDEGISDFKGIVFGKVTGYFDCSYNNLTSLEGCPKKVGSTFGCSGNNLTSLEGCPKEVGGDFYCNYNLLTSLEGCPKEVNGNFYCRYNNLTSLEGGPKEVGRHFYCSNNKLTSLEFSPEKVNGVFYCSSNKLTSLEFGPKEVGGSLQCSHNEGLSTKTIRLIFNKIGKHKLDYSDVLKSLWKEIPIEDKVLLYSSDLDWVEEDEADKLSKLKKYDKIKKMI